MPPCLRLLFVGLAALTACGGRAVSSAPEDAGSDEGAGPPSIDASVDAGDATSRLDATEDVADTGTDAPDDVPANACADAPDDVPPDTPAWGDAGTVYNDITDASFWSAYDTGGSGSAGGTFDGRYVYFAPNPTGAVTRYDTRADFTTASSWTTFDTTALDPNAKGFLGSAFDGRYVYFVPGSHGLVVRYDTQACFAATSSWSAFDIGIAGFSGAVFDGRYLYVTPVSPVQGGGVVARYDTQAAFAASSSWTTYTITSDVMGGGIFDGRYLYLPLYYEGLQRYDTQASFTAASAWATNGGGIGDKSNGLGFDGRYIYTLSPADYTGYAIDRFDTTAGFTASTSWSNSYPTNASALSRGAAFDGRYVYVVPGGMAEYSDPCCQVNRYDTQLPFQPSSWAAFDVTKLNSTIAGFHGAVFDGRYVYLVPGMIGTVNGIVARFDAKTPPSMPNLPGWNGSFF